MADLPSGTVTFLFTDIEGSTRLWEEHPDAMRDALARHDELVREAIEAHGGYVVKTTGDGFHAAFAAADSGVSAAVRAQRSLRSAAWGATGTLRVRMGLHTGVASVRDGDYFGTSLNRAARLMAVAHGGQVVCSQATTDLVRDASVDGVDFLDLGEHRLRDLTRAERVFEVRADGLEIEFPPLRSLDALPGNLPVEVSSFVGRDVEIARVEDVLLDSRVVTLTGVGGVGKTRLALHVAAEVIGRYPDGAWLCELASIADPDAVWEALASALRVAPRPGRSLEESVVEFLAMKRLLLVLDNCEHLLGGVARVVDAVVRRCPEVSVMATSREGLALDGERLLAVPALGVPDNGAEEGELLNAEAVRLFSDRASAAKDDFVLAGVNAAPVAVLCRRLDGIPLAIELAAARVRSMSPDDLVVRLDQRFKLLTRGSRAALERQQTLRATIDWSYALLDDSERRVLDRLSVFGGGCDLTAAERVLADDELDAVDVVEMLGQLVNKSLLVADDDAGTGAVRYRLLESIRQYAQEQLEARGETADVRRRHSDHFVEWAEQARAHLRGSAPEPWIAAALRDAGNFRAALDWAVEVASVDHALRLVAPMTLQGPVGEPALDWAATAGGIPGAADHPLYPEVAGWASWGATRAADFESAEVWATAARRADERLGRRHPTAVRAWATLAFFRGDLAAARMYAREWLALARSSGDQYELTHSLAMLGGALSLANEVEESIRALEESVKVARAAGIDAALVMPLSFLAGELVSEDPERALSLIDEAIEVATRADDLRIIASSTGMKGGVLANLGNWHDALAACTRSLDLCRKTGDALQGRLGVYAAATALCRLDAFDSSAVLLGYADSTGVRTGDDFWMTITQQTHDALLDRLGAARLDELVARGAALTFPDVVAFARAEADVVLGLLDA